jgi:hypothetical protein
MEDCPPTGCGDVADPFLNLMKNRTEIPPHPMPQDLTFIRRLHEPHTWTRGQARSSDIFRFEYKAVVVMAFLVGSRVSGSETANCRLTGQRNSDFILRLDSLRSSVPAQTVTAEVTPRVRPSGWTFEKLQELTNQKAFVRVTGWLMLDTEHIKSRLVRSTNWEIHPVTKLEFCTQTVTKCRGGDGWKDLQDSSTENNSTVTTNPPMIIPPREQAGPPVR